MCWKIWICSEKSCNDVGFQVWIVHSTELLLCNPGGTIRTSTPWLVLYLFRALDASLFNQCILFWIPFTWGSHDMLCMTVGCLFLFYYWGDMTELRWNCMIIGTCILHSLAGCDWKTTCLVWVYFSCICHCWKYKMSLCVDGIHCDCDLCWSCIFSCLVQVYLYCGHWIR